MSDLLRASLVGVVTQENNVAQSPMAISVLAHSSSDSKVSTIVVQFPFHLEGVAQCGARCLAHRVPGFDGQQHTHTHIHTHIHT